MKFIKELISNFKKKYYYIDNSVIETRMKLWKIESKIDLCHRHYYEKRIYWYYREGILYVMSYVPGVLIGKQGRLINKIELALRKENKHFKFIRMIELGPKCV